MKVLTVVLLTVLLGESAFGQSSGSTDSVSRCTADARWSNTNGNINYSIGAQTPTSLSLLVHLAKSCGSAELTFTATFLAENQDFICSGTIRQAMDMSLPVQTFNLDIRPFSQLDFLRWRNQPGLRGVQQGKRLMCTNVDGTSDLGDNDRQRAGWVRITIGVLPSGGGLAVAEGIIRVSP